MSLPADPLAMMALTPVAEDSYDIRAMRSEMNMRRKCVKDTLIPLCSKDPSGIICSYFLTEDKDFEVLLKLRQYVRVGDYVRNVMVYAYMLSRVLDGPDLLGYEYLSPAFQVRDSDNKLVSCMERTLLYAPSMVSPSMVAEILTSLIYEDYRPTKYFIEHEVELSYMNCISGERPEGKGDYVTCPYCLDIPIKYSYYKSGHKKTKKHVLNREAALKSGNYYRTLLKEGYEEDLIAMTIASVT